MDIPLKPWEIPQNSAYSNGVPYIPNTNTDRLHSTAVPFPSSGGGGGSLTTANGISAPQLPPRPGQSQYRPVYNSNGYGGYGTRSMMSYGYGAGQMYGTGYSSQYYNPYNSYSSPMGGMYGAAPGRMSPYGPQNGPNGEPSFSQLAEESSASAFQSIDSFVGAFSSISAMLESTFHAVYSSFRAVVGVADHLGRVKQVLSALAVFRFFKWMMRRILYLIGVSKIKPEQIESVWNSLSNQQNGLDPSDWENELKPGGRPSSWPILMFLGFIFAGPYLMWKLIRSLNLNSRESNTKWATGEEEHFIASAEFDFGTTMTGELSVRKGQTIRLAPAPFQPPNVKGWVLASDGRRIGLVPTNYIKVLGKRSANPVPIRTTNLAYNNTSSNGSNQTLPPPSTPSSVLPLPKPVLEDEPNHVPTFTTASNDYLHLRPAVLASTTDSATPESNSNGTLN